MVATNGSESDSIFECGDRKDGFYPDLGDNKIFYVCYDGISTKLHCPESKFQICYFLKRKIKINENDHF